VTQLPEWPPKDEVVGFFNQHIVPIFFTFKKGEKRHSGVITTSVLSILDQWFLVTAGHCIEQIEDNVKKYGYIIEKCRLIDSAGLEAKFHHPIPFDYDGAYPTHSKNPDFDYGLILIREHYRSLLQANGIIPLNEEVWEKQPENPDFFLLLGVPDQLTEIENEKLRIIATLHVIEPFESRPDCFSETSAPTFYGKIRLSHPVTNIEGMSGGPVLSFKKTKTGELKYWLHAMQSRWILSKKYIAACLTKPFAGYIKNIIEKHIKK